MAAGENRFTSTPQRTTARSRQRYSSGDADLDSRLHALLDEVAGELVEADSRLAFEILVTAVRLAQEPLSRLDRKLLNASLKEMRYAFGVFSRYRGRKKVSVFGSARTPTDDPNYQLAVDFGRRIAEAGWMVVTGAGPGIMSAGNEGAGEESSFGVNIVLPFEAKPNEFIARDPKLINFKYFFTRKLMFIKEADAFVLFPGGFGTLDELFELLTLSQTGKSDPHPIVMLEAGQADYWSAIDAQLRDVLAARGFIDPDDLRLYHITTSVDDALAHIERFYRVYHSQRYVGGHLVLRLNQDIDDACVGMLNDEFRGILTGPIERAEASPGEIQDDDVPHLPRLTVPFDRFHFARLRTLIDRLNDCG